jgi:hypothetical protein
VIGNEYFLALGEARDAGPTTRPKRDRQIFHSNRIIYQPIAILFLGVLFFVCMFLETPRDEHKKFLVEIFPYRSRLIRA